MVHIDTVIHVEVVRKDGVETEHSSALRLENPKLSSMILNQGAGIRVGPEIEPPRGLQGHFLEIVPSEKEYAFCGRI